MCQLWDYEVIEVQLMKFAEEVNVKCIFIWISYDSYDDFTCRPRMISKDGHLTFMPANNKDIYFDTSGAGRVKVGNEDLTEQLKQVI